MIGDTFCHLWPNHVAPKSGINRSQCIVRNSQGAFFVRPAGRISIVRECVKLLDQNVFTILQDEKKRELRRKTGYLLYVQREDVNSRSISIPSSALRLLIKPIVALRRQHQEYSTWWRALSSRLARMFSWPSRQRWSCEDDILTQATLPRNSTIFSHFTLKANRSSQSSATKI